MPLSAPDWVGRTAQRVSRGRFYQNSALQSVASHFRRVFAKVGTYSLGLSGSRRKFLAGLTDSFPQCSRNGSSLLFTPKVRSFALDLHEQPDLFSLDHGAIINMLDLRHGDRSTSDPLKPSPLLFW